MHVNSSNMLQYSYNMIFTLLCQYRILCSMLRIDRKPHSGGRVLTAQQEWAVVEMVRARNDIRLSEIKQAIEEDNDTFPNVASISIPTIGRLLKRHHVSMKHIYLVPFERNNDRVKQLRAEYVQVRHYIFVLLILFDTLLTSYVYWNNTVKIINRNIFFSR